MAFRWPADYGPTLNGSFVVFQWIHTSIAKKPYIFVIFQGVSEHFPPAPSGSPNVLLMVDDMFITALTTRHFYIPLLESERSGRVGIKIMVVSYHVPL